MSMKFKGAAHGRLCRIFLGSVSALAVSTAVASAQDAATGAPTPETPAAAAASEPEEAQVGEIVVTAQRRSERLQDVPLAVSAVTPETAQRLGLRNVRDVQLTMPSTDLAQGTGFLQLYIRGTGQAFATPGLEAPVTIYMDGMYVPRAGGFNSLLNIVDPGSIELMRGPQGTLYGRNTTGGVILLNSALPTDRLEGRVLAEYGRFDHKQFEGMLNVPLTDTVSARFAGRFTDEHGYVTNIATGVKLPQVHNYTVRGTVRWQPNDAADVVFGAEYQRGGPTFGSVDQLGAGAPICWLCTRTGVQPAQGFYKTNQSETRPWKQSLFRTYLKATLEVGSLDFTSLTTYLRDKIEQEGEQDYTPASAFWFQNNQGGETFSQEVQVASSFSGPFNFLAGATYLNDKPYIKIFLRGSDYLFAANATGFFPGGENEITTKSISGFVEGSYRITDKLKVTAGGRYTHDKRSIRGRNNPGFQLFGLPPAFSASKSFDAFTPRFVLAWDNGATNVYYSFTRGFKAGGFSTPAPLLSRAVGPEKVSNHEVGLKNSALGGRLRTNAALFYFKNKGLQTQIIDPTSGGNRTENAGSVSGKGVELEVTFRATDDLTIAGSLGYMDVHYTRYVGASQVCFDSTGTLNAAAPGATLYPCALDLSGTRVPHAPRYQASLNASYDFRLGDWTGNVAGVAQYRSSYDYFAGAGGPLKYDQQKGYVVANMSAFISPPGEKLRLGVYIENLFDKKYTSLRSTNQPYGVTYTAAKPRTYGVRVEYRFE